MHGYSQTETIDKLCTVLNNSYKGAGSCYRIPDLLIHLSLAAHAVVPLPLTLDRCNLLQRLSVQRAIPDGKPDHVAAWS